MQLFYAGIILLMCGAAVAWASMMPSQPEGPSPKMVERMNAIDPNFTPYSTMCFKGKKVIYMYHSIFYELDDDKPVRCVK